MFRPYVTVLRVRGAAVPAVASFLGALPIGMLNLGVVLAVRATTGSFAAAGAVGGAFGLGNAIGLVVQGRLISRWGQTWLLVATALLCPVSLVAFTAAAGQRVSLPVLAVWGAAAGASIPAVTSSMRVLWPVLVTDAALRPVAYALLATEFQVAMVTGPLLVSGLLLVGGASVVLLVAAGLACGAGLLLAAAPSSRRWRPAPVSSTGRRRAGAGMYTLLVGAAGGGVTSGMLIVGVPAAAAGQHWVGLAGVLFAAFSAGELLGGVAYGGRAWRSPPVSRLVNAQIGTAVGIACLAVLTSFPRWMLPVMFVVGVFTAPVSIGNSVLLDDAAPAASLARSYTVMVAAGLLGGAGGNLAGGLLERNGGRATVFVVAAGTMAFVALWTHARRGTLTTATRCAEAAAGRE